MSPVLPVNEMHRVEVDMVPDKSENNNIEVNDSLVNPVTQRDILSKKVTKPEQSSSWNWRARENSNSKGFVTIDSCNSAVALLDDSVVGDLLSKYHQRPQHPKD